MFKEWERCGINFGIFESLASWYKTFHKAKHCLPFTEILKTMWKSVLDPHSVNKN